MPPQTDQLRFDIDPDIRRASTPPSWVYTSHELFELARDRIFARTWQFIGDVGLVRVPGQVHPFTLLEGCLDEPLLLTRDASDAIHCLSNVCTHRGMIVCPGGAVERTLRCRYHGRRFGLDGRFHSMPEFDGVVGFPSPADDLARVPHGRWGPLLLASLRPAMALDEALAPLRERVGWLPIDQCRFDAARSREYLIQCNWALYCENYLEGFHIPYVHNSLNDAIDYGSYRTDLYRWSSVQVAQPRSGDVALLAPPSSPDHGTSIAAYYWWIFPNTMFNVYPWGISMNVVRPLAVDRTRVSFLTYVWDESKLDRGAGASLDRVEREDEAVVEAVQRGVRSRLYSRGRYSPARETGTHHFHRLLAEFLSPDSADRPR